jgi:hypothetical protein
MRITKNDLKVKEERVNGLLRNVKLKVGFRYDYTAIDVADKEGRIISTLISGLTKRQAFYILDSIEQVLRYEGRT